MTCANLGEAQPLNLQFEITLSVTHLPDMPYYKGLQLLFYLGPKGVCT